MSGIISAPQFFRVFPDLNPENVGDSQASIMQAFYTAIYEVGCLAGATFALLYGNHLGRRKNIMIGTHASRFYLFPTHVLTPLAASWLVAIGAIIQITAIPGYVSFLGSRPCAGNANLACHSFKAGHQFVIGRIVTGVGNGSAIYVAHGNSSRLTSIGM